MVDFEFAETGRGWITMTLWAPGQETSPLPDLLRWAEKVATWTLPQALSIDEEGHGKLLSVQEHEGQVQLVVRSWRRLA